MIERSGSTEPTAQPTTQPTAQPATADAAAPASASAFRADASRGELSRRRRRILAAVSGAAAIALVAGTGGVAVGAVGMRILDVHAAAGSSGARTISPALLQPGSATTPTTPTTPTTAATASEAAGVVTIVSEIGFGAGEAAGTGIVLRSDGLILTNNHVIAGSTRTVVTDESTGRSYEAEVVGTDAVHDVAVLQLVGASGLTTAALDTDDDVMIGDAVASIGNAGGTGDLVTAAGTVADLDQSITVRDERTGAARALAGLIEVDADVVPGDSGGPLIDDEGEVVGIVTAASEGASAVTGFAIPLTDALAIARQIESGQASGTVVIGVPAFLGVELAGTSATGGAPTTAGAVVGGVVPGTGAAEAGLAAGDVITAVDGAAVSDPASLSAAVAAHAPGDEVTLTVVDAAGTSTQVTVTLTSGPAA